MFLARILNFLDDEDEFVNDGARRRPRIINPRPDYFQKYDDFDFVRRFRLTKEATMMVLGDIEVYISPPSQRNNAVPALHRLLLALRFYATGCMVLTAADYAGVSSTTACDIIFIVTMALVKVRPLYMKMPGTPEELRKIKKDFYEIAGMPGVVGAIDCTHVRLQSPGGNQAEVFRNRKGFMSLNVQTVADPSLKIIDMAARWPGSVHDQTIFNNSRIKRRFEAHEFGSSILIGDSGYANSSYLITPLPTVHSDVENLYNESVIRTRNTVERQYGVWKRRFPILHVGIRLSLARAQAVIVACAVLHNIALHTGEPDPPQDPDVPPYNAEEFNFDAHPLGPGNDAMRRRLLTGHFQQLWNERN